MATPKKKEAATVASKSKLLLTLKEEVVQLRSELKTEREEREKISNWIQNTLKPQLKNQITGLREEIENLKENNGSGGSSAEISREEFENLKLSINVEKESRNQLSLWLKQQFGKNLELLDSRIDARVAGESFSSSKNQMLALPESVSEWLKLIGYDRFTNEFQRAKITDFEKLFHLNEKKLYEIGVDLKKQRADILHEIQTLKTKLSNAKSTATSENQQVSLTIHHSAAPSQPNTNSITFPDEEQLQAKVREEFEKTRSIDDEKRKLQEELEREKRKIEKEKQKIEKERQKMELERKRWEEEVEQQRNKLQKEKAAAAAEAKRIESEKEKEKAAEAKKLEKERKEKEKQEKEKLEKDKQEKERKEKEKQEKEKQEKEKKARLEKEKQEKLEKERKEKEKLEKERKEKEKLEKEKKEKEEKEKKWQKKKEISSSSSSEEEANHSEEENRSQSEEVKEESSEEAPPPPKEDSKSKRKSITDSDSSVSTSERSSGGSGGKSFEQYILDVRDDNNATNWVVFYFDKASNSVLFSGCGQKGHAELIENLDEEKVQYALLRVVDKQRRIKFVYIHWVGKKAHAFVKARSGTKKAEVQKLIGQYHIEILAETLDDITPSAIITKLKSAVNF